MQPAQADHLRQLIDTSPVLQPAEKAEWADMLILMNDKQAAELEQILDAHHAMAAPAGASTPSSISSIPPLSHISNLPNELNPITRPIQSRPQIASPPASPAMPWQKQFEASLEEKELPAPKPGSATQPVPKAPTPASPTVRPQAPQAQSHAKSPAQSPGSSQAPKLVASLETIADAGKLTPATMRGMDLRDLAIRLQQLSKMEGYFNLLAYLEDSPLYKSYIATGKKALVDQAPFGQAGAADPNALTKREFEAFADILRKIQIN